MLQSALGDREGAETEEGTEGDTEGGGTDRGGAEGWWGVEEAAAASDRPHVSPTR